MNTPYYMSYNAKKPLKPLIVQVRVTRHCRSSCSPATPSSSTAQLQAIHPIICRVVHPATIIILYWLTQFLPCELSLTVKIPMSPLSVNQYVRETICSEDLASTLCAGFYRDNDYEIVFLSVNYTFLFERKLPITWLGCLVQPTIYNLSFKNHPNREIENPGVS